jgi:division/cell wall cluster transcriptional repressor MraZ
MDSENVALFGCSETTIDAEGRVSLPNNLSCALGSEPIMFSSLTGDSVWVMSDEPAFRAYIDKLFEDKFGGFNPENSEHARLEKALMGGAWHTTLETDGSLLIPQELAERVALGKDVAVIGVDDHVEIMALKVWEEICSAITYLKRII